MSLQRGQLALNLLATEVTTQNIYADGRTHYVAFYSDTRGYVSWWYTGTGHHWAQGPAHATLLTPQAAAVRG